MAHVSFLKNWDHAAMSSSLGKRKNLAFDGIFLSQKRLTMLPWLQIQHSIEYCLPSKELNHATMDWSLIK